MDLLGQPLRDRGLSHTGLADEDRVVLASPCQDVDGALELDLATDQRVEFSLGGVVGEIPGEGLERIWDLAILFHARRRLSWLTLASERLGAGELGYAVGDVLEHVEPRRSLCAQELDGVRVRLLEERGDQVARLHLLALRAVGVSHRGLEHPMERDRLAGLDGLSAWLRVELIVQEAVEIRLEPTQIRPAVLQHLRASGVVNQGVEQVLDGHVGVTPGHRLPHGGVQRHLELSRDVAHSGSAPARNG